VINLDDFERGLLMPETDIEELKTVIASKVRADLYDQRLESLVDSINKDGFIHLNDFIDSDEYLGDIKYEKKNI